MKKYFLYILLVGLLAGCSEQQMTTVDELYDNVEKPAAETISKSVTVYTVVGDGKGQIIAEDERNKWIEVSSELVSQHPTSLVESSLGKLYKADLVGFDGDKAYIHIKCSVDVTDDIDELDPQDFTMKLTYQERLALKESYSDVKRKPSEKISDYEEPIFTQNPDDIEQFIHDYELAEDKASYIANDLLRDALQQTSKSTVTYRLEEVQSIKVGYTVIKVSGLLEFIDDGKESEGSIVYTITSIDDQFKIINIEMSED